MSQIEQLSDEEIIVASDGSQGYYCVWRPLTSIGQGITKVETLADIREVALFGIETMVDLKRRQIENNS